MLNIHLHYFAMLRERRGLSEESLVTREGITAEELYSEMFPEHHENGLRVAYAINERYAQPSTVLKDGDTLVFIPPVGGG